MKTNGNLLPAAICLSVFVLGFVAPKASAQTILPVSQARSISASGVSTSAVDFAPFNVSIQSDEGANQTSMINSASITASGFAFGNGSTGLAASRFSVTFDIASDCSYTLSGNVFWSNRDGGQGAGPPFVLLSSTSGTNFYAHALPMGGVVFSTNDVLPSGEYTLSAQAAADAFHGENDSYSLSFSVTPVPEPATLTFLLLGTAAFLSLRRSRPSPPR
jgi:hypothetical protein